MYLDTRTERILAMILHLSGLLNGALPIVIPLVIWLWKKDESFFLKEHGKAALNFQLSVLVIAFIAITFTVLTIGIGAIIVVPLAILFGLLYLYFIFLATLTASNGQLYVYPFSWEFIK